MTAEVAILNKNAVALAADSAVTVGNKVYPSVNKVFALSETKPIGIMVYGNSEILGTPWETIIKMYRQYLSNRSYSKLEGYFEDFLNYLITEPSLFDQEEIDSFIENRIYLLFNWIRQDIDRAVRDWIQKNGSINEIDLDSIKHDIVDYYNLGVDESIEIFDHTPELRDDLFERYNNTIDQTRNNIFQGHTLNQDDLDEINNLAVSQLVKFWPTDFASGLVFSGFGDDQKYPSLRSCEIDGIVMGRLRRINKDSIEISDNNKAALVPYAQRDMMDIFMQGIDPRLKHEIISYIDNLLHHYPALIIDNISKLDDPERRELQDTLNTLSGQLLDYFESNLDKTIKEKFVKPVIDTIGILPIGELASMAESLVSLTSLKRRVTLDIETVGGPIDVAVISKGDGFIWVKRKAYFDRKLNIRQQLNALSKMITTKESEDG